MAAIPEAARASCFAGHDLQSCGPAVCCWPVKKLAKICTRHQKQKKGKRINHWITDFLHCFCAMNFIIASKYKKEVLSFKDQTTDTFEFIELCSVTVAFGSLEAPQTSAMIPILVGIGLLFSGSLQGCGLLDNCDTDTMLSSVD